MEFWLNQNTYNGGQGDLLAQAQVSLVRKGKREEEGEGNTCTV